MLICVTIWRIFYQKQIQKHGMKFSGEKVDLKRPKPSMLWNFWPSNNFLGLWLPWIPQWSWGKVCRLGFLVDFWKKWEEVWILFGFLFWIWQEPSQFRVLRRLAPFWHSEEYFLNLKSQTRAKMSLGTQDLCVRDFSNREISGFTQALN